MALLKRKHETILRLDELADKMSRRLRRRFLEAVRNIDSAFTLGEIVEMVETGRTEQAIQVAETAFQVVADDANEIMVLAGRRTGIWLSGRLGRMVSFDQTNDRAIAAMRRRRLTLVREMVDEQRLAIREVLNEGVVEGVNPRELARRFRGAIGLTQAQQNAVVNYRALLRRNSKMALGRALRDRRFDPTVRRAIETDTPLTRQQIDRMVERYRERYLKYRAEVIGRTESLAATHEGNEEMLQQAIEGGHVDAERLERSWIVRLDGRQRDSHGAMSGQKRPVGEPFLTGNGFLIRFPGDPRAPLSEIAQCRCGLITRMKRQEAAPAA